MYTENVLKDTVLFGKAFLSNILAGIAPRLYVNLTSQTGRGSNESNSSDIADYFIKCVDDYQYQLNLDKESFYKYLDGKIILEYGPGDILGVAFLLYAYGAKKVICVDRFPLSKMSEINIEVYTVLLNSLSYKEKERAEKVFNKIGEPSSGLNNKYVDYCVMMDGLSGAVDEYDLVISRAVLEHVNELEKIMLDIKHSLKIDGISIHQVDLKSHGLDRYVEYDFLTWPNYLYKLMYSHKGFPNRYRIDKYREHIKKIGLNVVKITPIDFVDENIIDFIYPKLDKQFKEISIEELSWKGFWVCFTK